MGKAMSVVGRQVQRFNVENRAQKVISQTKPKPAPKYESNLRDLERVLREHPDIVAEQSRKNVQLDENLRQVYVTSKDVAIDPKGVQTQDPDKPLPINRSTVDEYEFGHLEPRTVTKGRCTLRQAVQFIANHQTDPQQWTAAKVAEYYNMKETLVKNILDHFKSFEVHLPDKNLERRRVLTRATTEAPKQIE